MQFSHTRIAPTPSGFLHIGNALSFAVTATLAERYKASILLRIDDLDRERLQREYVEDIFETLRFLEIPWQEGPRQYSDYEQQYSQIHRLPLYNAALQQLKESGQVFACECSRANMKGGIYPGTCKNKNLPLDTPDTAWRLHTTINKPLRVKTLDGIIETSLPADMQYFVIKKKNGYPSYQLSSLIDDEHFGIDLIVRGQDLWDSTLAQLYLAAVMDIPSFMQTTFYYHPLLLETPEQKLSKSAGSTSIQHLRKEGKTAAEVYRMISSTLGLSTLATDFRSLGEQVLGSV